MSYPSSSTDNCKALLPILRRYGDTNVFTLRTILVCLSVVAIITFAGSLLHCICPPYHVSRYTASLLIVCPVAVLVPYFIFDTSLDSLDVTKIPSPMNVTAVTLPGLLKKCNSTGDQKDKFPPLRMSSNPYYFGSLGDGWDAGVIACAVGTGVVAVREVFMLLRGRRLAELDAEIARQRAERSAALREEAERRADLLGDDGAPRSAEDVMRVLARLRVDDAPESVLRAKQCAICLDDMREGEITMLLCAHSYHEHCIGEWLQTARRRECPMCKTAIEEAPPQRRSSLDRTEAATAGTEPEIATADDAELGDAQGIVEPEGVEGGNEGGDGGGDGSRNVGEVVVDFDENNDVR